VYKGFLGATLGNVGLKGFSQPNLVSQDLSNSFFSHATHFFSISDQQVLLV
jgi:hypothetical protein